MNRDFTLLNLRRSPASVFWVLSNRFCLYGNFTHLVSIFLVVLSKYAFIGFKRKSLIKPVLKSDFGTNIALLFLVTDYMCVNCAKID